MQIKQNITLSDQDIKIDLTLFNLEADINEYWSKKGWPTRFFVRDLTPDIITITTRGGHPEALYIKSTNQLYRIQGNLQINWSTMKRCVKKVFPDVNIMEFL